MSELIKAVTEETPNGPLEGFYPGVYEIAGKNRHGKTILNVKGAWEAYLDGKKVYCNCPIDPITGNPNHILKFPHYDYEPAKLFYYDLWDCYVMMDEGGNFMDSARRTKEVTDIYKWGYQVKKRGIEFRYDTVRGKNIEFRVRSNPDFWLNVERIPKDWHKPLVAVRVKVTSAGGLTRSAYISDPTTYFKLYNHTVLVQPGRED